MFKALLANSAAADATVETHFSTDQSEVWVSFLLYGDLNALNTWVATSSGYFAQLWNSTHATQINFLDLDISGWHTAFADGLEPKMQAAQWMLCEVHHKNGGTAEFFINGLHVGTGTDTHALDTRYVTLGLASAPANPNSKAYIADVRIGTTRGGADIFFDNFSTGDLSKWTSTSGAVSVVDAPAMKDPQLVIQAMLDASPLLGFSPFYDPFTGSYIPEWTGQVVTTGGTLSIVNDTLHTNIVGATSGAVARLYKQLGTSVVTDGTFHFIRTKFKIAALSNPGSVTDKQHVLTFEDASGAYVGWSVQQDSTLIFEDVIGGSYTSAALVTGVQHEIAYGLQVTDVGGGNFTWIEKAYLDGVLVHDVTNTLLATPVQDRFCLGPGAITSSFNSTYEFDDFRYGPDYNATEGTWTDLTKYALPSVTIQFGRSFELDQVQAGIATVPLDNSDRRFDPTNSSGPYYGNLLPERRLRIGMIFGGTTYWLYHGFIQEWPIAWEGTGWATTTIQAADGFEPLSVGSLVGAFSSELTGARMNAILDAFGWSVNDRLIDAGNTTMPAVTFSVGETTALNHASDVVTTESGLFFADGSGRAVFQNRHFRFQYWSSLNPQATFGDTDFELPYLDVIPSFDKQHLFNDWTVNPPTGTPQQAEDATSITEFWRRSNTISTQCEDSLVNMDQANYYVLLYKDPNLRFDSVTVQPVASPAVWYRLLGVGISNRLRIVRRPPGGSYSFNAADYAGAAIVKDVHVESIGWQFGETAADTLTTFELSPVGPTNFLTLDDPSLGVLGSNLLGY